MPGTAHTKAAGRFAHAGLNILVMQDDTGIFFSFGVASCRDTILNPALGFVDVKCFCFRCSENRVPLFLQGFVVSIVVVIFLLTIRVSILGSFLN